jgi:hypothetical protein
MHSDDILREEIFLACFGEVCSKELGNTLNREYERPLEEKALRMSHSILRGQYVHNFEHCRTIAISADRFAKSTFRCIVARLRLLTRSCVTVDQ